jgi:hypothetical protein
LECFISRHVWIKPLKKHVLNLTPEGQEVVSRAPQLWVLLMHTLRYLLLLLLAVLLLVVLLLQGCLQHLADLLLCSSYPGHEVRPVDIHVRSAHMHQPRTLRRLLVCVFRTNVLGWESESFASR